MIETEIQNRIDGYFNKLIDFIKKLPLTNNGKNQFMFTALCKFYDEQVISEDGSFTYGIKSEWQLQRFIEQFKKDFQKTRIKAIEKWTDKLNKLETSKAVSKIDKHLYELRKMELLSEIGADGLNDWQKWLKKYLNNEKEYQLAKEPATPPPTTEPEQPKAKPGKAKQIPDLPQIFKSRDYFDTVISRLKNDEFIELNRITGRYKWLKSKAFLAGLASKLEKCNRLQNLDNYPDFKINTEKKQDLGRAFCKYFENIDFSEPIDKTFQDKSITGTQRKPYFWITEV